MSVFPDQYARNESAYMRSIELSTAQKRGRDYIHWIPHQVAEASPAKHNERRLPQLLDTLVVLGKARVLEDGRWMG